MGMRTNFSHTLRASYLGYITQAVVNSLVPLLFLTIRSTYRLSLEQIAFLVTVNFGTQLAVDLLAARFVDRIGYRISIVAAHLFAGSGLLCLSVLPDLSADPYIGLIASVAVYGVGGGLIEVLLSPIVQACPTKEKSSAMCLLHSFNCWGQVLVVVLSTAFFTLAGIERWRLLVRLWACVPFLNAAYFSAVPIRTLAEEEMGDCDGNSYAEHASDRCDGDSCLRRANDRSIRRLFSMRLFWILFVLMLCSGASEQAMSQWASAFAELGLGVSKAAGDLAGPCMFAFLMGTSRLFYARHYSKIDLQRYILGSSVACLCGYLLASLSPHPALSLVGCGLCGLSIGILWPGVYSTAAEWCPRGGTAMFALLALGGDVGCLAGPTLVGLISSGAENGLKSGLLCASLFPLLLASGILCLKWEAGKSKQEVRLPMQGPEG